MRLTLHTYPAATLGLTVLPLIAATACVRYARDRLDEMLYGEQYAFSTFEINVFTFQVASMNPAAEAAGLRKGDLLLAVNGRPVDGFADFEGQCAAPEPATANLAFSAPREPSARLG